MKTKKEETKKQIEDEYDKIKDLALAEYRKIKDLAYAEYYKIKNPAYAERQRKLEELNK